MRDLKLENMIERIASKLAEALGWNVIGKVDYSLWQKYGKNRTYVRVKIICIKGEKRSERKIFGYDFGFIDNEDEKHYLVNIMMKRIFITMSYIKYTIIFTY